MRSAFSVPEGSRKAMLVGLFGRPAFEALDPLRSIEKRITKAKNQTYSLRPPLPQLKP